MQNKVAAFAATPDPTFGQQQPAAKPDVVRSTEPAAPATDPVDLRLVIEEDQASGSYVYKTINRLTGEVVQQFPREQILRLREEVRYTAGAVIRARA
ncbi:flagellar protein FlaG [Phenylobacterium sp.]|uniref:flagellar protein FlaG n=1 Tax=Phenylobacterium sp. TaxID=1871053 RepID=UPI003982F499